MKFKNPAKFCRIRERPEIEDSDSQKALTLHIVILQLSSLFPIMFVYCMNCAQQTFYAIFNILELETIIYWLQLFLMF